MDVPLSLNKGVQGIFFAGGKRNFLCEVNIFMMEVHGRG